MVVKMIKYALMLKAIKVTILIFYVVHSMAVEIINIHICISICIYIYTTTDIHIAM